ncbi:MAG: hypothetical protein JNK58_07165 [Phycisphaerae bacterium]|nr:hypothetical protein [Phycisphaerae bacterium]
MLRSACTVLVLLAPASLADAATLAGFNLLGTAPQVRIDYSSDYGPPQIMSLLAPNSGPWTGQHFPTVAGNGPGAATARIDIICPAPQATPGNPTIIRYTLDVSNFDVLRGLTASGSANPVRFNFSPAGNRFYRIECTRTYQNFAGDNGYGAVTLNVSGNVHPIHPALTVFNNGSVTSVFTGTTGTSPVDVHAFAELYQGQSNDGHGRLIVEYRVWVDSVPVPAPCPGDADGDRSIGFGDITSILTNWGASYAPGTGPGDANFDGTVNFSDITETLTSFGASCPA